MNWGKGCLGSRQWFCPIWCMALFTVAHQQSLNEAYSFITSKCFCPSATISCDRNKHICIWTKRIFKQRIRYTSYSVQQKQSKQMCSGVWPSEDIWVPLLTLRTRFRSMSTGHTPMITGSPLHHSCELKNKISVLLQWHVGGTEVRSWLNQFSVHPWGHLAAFPLYVCLLLESLSLVDPELSYMLKFYVVETEQLLTHYACANNTS